MPDDLERGLAAFGQTLGARSSEPIRPDRPAAVGATGTSEPPSSNRRWWAVAGAAAIVLAAVGGFVVVSGRGDERPDIAPIDSGDTVPVTVEPAPPSSEPPDTTRDATVTTQPDEPAAVAGPWTRECVEELGEPREYGPDEFVGEPFGPLAPEPGLRILYPDSAVADGTFSAPVSSVSRIPGGTLIRLTSAATEQGQIVVVVDDDGSIRWRRCIPDIYGWSSVVDGAAGVAHLQVYPMTTNEQEWWTFDLATGEHDIGEPQELPAEWPEPEIAFTGDWPDQALRRVGTDGTERWRRDDLIDPGDEGFRVAGSGIDGHPVLVRACIGDRDQGGQCRRGLLGLDGDDGSTVWQLDDDFGVSLIADGYAIVTDPDGPGSTYQLIDLDTGARVPDGISGAPGAFLAECCGGYDYNRVERDGALAWSVASHWLDVWFPADRAGPGVAVDVLGASATPSVTAQRHWTLVRDCPGGPCSSIRTIGRGFSPGTTVTVRCWWNDGDGWEQVGGSAELQVGPDGSVAADGPCGAPLDAWSEVDVGVRVTFDDVPSNIIAT